MPQFILSRPAKPSHPFYALDNFAKGYVEAMFFTNGDTGDERENLLNDWGVECLTHDAVKNIREECAAFRCNAKDDLDEALDNCGLDDEQLGRDFWFSRQGHGVGFTDRGDAGCLERLQDHARSFGECYVEAYRKKIHVR